MLSAKEKIMGRPTKLDRCCRCDHEARLGVYMGFYILRSKGKGGVSKPIKPKSFPARGYCIDCFLELAKRTGLPGKERQALREALEGRRSVSAPGRKK
jgi:hypothetical protein